MGGDHPQTLKSYCNLASILGILGRYEEAHDRQEALLLQHEAIYGAGHVDTLRCMSNLGVTKQELWRLREAAALQQRAWTGQQEKLGPAHPETLTSLLRLTDALVDMGMYEEAGALQLQALRLIENVPSARTRGTFHAANDLAKKLLEKNRTAEAYAWLGSVNAAWVQARARGGA